MIVVLMNKENSKIRTNEPATKKKPPQNFTACGGFCDSIFNPLKAASKF
jgi:hypothetical protein